MSEPRLRIARTRTDPVDARLDEAARQAMYELFARYYEDVERDKFFKDLDDKQHVIRMLGVDGELLGFSTLQLLETEFEGRSAAVLFSGDTVVDHRAWGQKALQQGFVAFVTAEKLRQPRRPLYWFLISKGYKTYLLTRKNFRCFPNHAAPTPPRAQALLDHVAQLKYPGDYDPERGVIAFPTSQGKVRGEFEDLGPEELAHPDIAYFVARNPGYRDGDELCTIAEIRLRDLAFIGLKYFLYKPLVGLFKGRPK